MSEMRPARLLHEVCDIVERELDRPMRISDQSYFANMLNSIEELDKRHFVQNYVSDLLRMLLLGVIDQARCMALAVDTPGIAVTPFILIRTLIEYSYKITYISDPLIEPKERIRRVLDLWYLDSTSYKKLPKDLQLVMKWQSQRPKKEVEDWYRQLTGRGLAKKTAEFILDAVWKAGLETSHKNNEVTNEIYEQVYRVGSAFQHGNSWAIQHYCLGKPTGGNDATTLHSQSIMVFYFLRMAGVLLQASCGSVVQFQSMLPANVMNEIGEKIAELEKMRGIILTEEALEEKIREVEEIREEVLRRKKAQSTQD